MVSLRLSTASIKCWEGDVYGVMFQINTGSEINAGSVHRMERHMVQANADAAEP